MAGTPVVVYLVAFGTVIAFYGASATPIDMFHQQNQAGPLQPAFPLSGEGAGPGPKDCFHFFVSRNVSALLAEATRMLPAARTRREREWLLAFVHRIRALAEHLRGHPGSRNYLCLPSDDPSADKRILAEVQQPELYFEDDLDKRVEGDVQPNQALAKPVDQQQPPEAPSNALPSQVVQDPPSTTRSPPASTTSTTTTEASPMVTQTEDSGRVVAPTKTEAAHETTQAIDKKSGIGDFLPDCDKTKECDSNGGGEPRGDDSPERGLDGDPMYLAETFSPEDVERYEQERLKMRIRKALIEELAPEIRKLKTVGGTPEDLMYLWNGYIPAEALPEKRSEDPEADFDYEDAGAAIGDLTTNEKAQPERKVAPSLAELKNTKDRPKDAYDESDVLVQQLLDARFGDQPSKTTKPLGDGSSNQNEYLITSTSAPF